ncbi:glycosyltransferase family 4 protein [Neobacillus sp. MM2021_6]|uniref:glycosyltransferase family 4 protein n=1 Tax=Bacillaceae TaxID=186817 RepID=UPI001408EEE3|nr:MULTISPECIES: glycosyltransferase family 4 protein [Bacillaceae]MBO0959952.1 glycosyltransferase family 4 protein [Neobacillus sp. MM2021_6]NHC18902.1 glycosyltransferase family 4 protein [Bacillus sp. MM2020_4]
MRKILYIASTLQRSGPINVLYNIVKYINKDQFNLAILTLSPESEDSRIGEFIKLGIKVEQIKMSRISGVLYGAIKVKAFINNYQPDVIHTHGIRADLISAKYLKGFQRCSTSHNYPYYDYPLAYGKLRGYIMSYFQINAFRKIEFPIACSQTITNLTNTHNLELYTIQNGIDNEIYRPVREEERQRLRTELGLPLEKKIFISSGNLIQRKDPITVIKGFLASKIMSDSILIFIGDGPLRSACEELIKEYPNIIMIGHVENVSDFLKVADYMISASHAEGLPMAVLEALASGLPVCLSDIEPHKELLSFNSKAGVIFSEGSSTDLAEKIDDLVKMSNNEILSKNALSIINNHLSAKVMAKKYEDVYRQLIL